MSTSILQRTSTRVLIGWTIAAAFLAFLVYRHNQHTCDSAGVFGQNACQLAGAEPSFWQPFFAILVIGLVIGAIVWAVIRPRKRLCPACGTDAPRGVTACGSCGHDFAAAATAAPATTPPVD
jgi:lysylphosphatidylglycerol synthetase-like protein (DUF2156 family)